MALNEIRADHRVRLEAEPNNAHDPEAVAVYLQEHKIGYVPRQQAPAVGRLLSNAAIAATIERVNGSAERPLIYLFTRIRSSTTSSVSPRRWAQ
ncbi:MAG: HIRAN domain-containing protein [Rhodanobacteraceae bacterium]